MESSDPASYLKDEPAKSICDINSVLIYSDDLHESYVTSVPVSPAKIESDRENSYSER